MKLIDITTIEDTAALLTQTLKDSGFEGDLSRGSPIRQLLIDPCAVLHQVQLDEQDRLRNSWRLLTDGFSDDKNYDLEVITNLFNNLQVTPSAGTKSRGTLQLTFSTKDVRTIRADQEFIALSGETFVPAQAYTLIPSESYRSSFNATELVFQETNQGYSVLIDVIATTYTEGGIANGTTFTTTLYGLLSAVAAESFVGGRRNDSLLDLVMST